VWESVDGYRKSRLQGLATEASSRPSGDVPGADEN
jgi:hypothetical protein